MRHAQTKTSKVVQQIVQQQAQHHAPHLHYFNLYGAPLITLALVYAMARLAAYSMRQLLTRGNDRRIAKW